MNLEYDILVGDAGGVDCLVQEYLKESKYKNLRVYYSWLNTYSKPRNTNGYKAIGVRGNYQDRDQYMCGLADYGLAIWDQKSKGTLNNIKRIPKTKVILVN
jgi:adenine-specific DNA-methyltransferase